MCQSVQSIKDVLPVSETSLKGFRQLSGSARSLILSEIPCVTGRRGSVKIATIKTIKLKLLKMKDFVFFFLVLLSSDPNACVCG